MKEMIESWHEECQELDVTFKDGRLVLSQISAMPETSFEEQLGGLNRKWSEMVVGVENQKKKAEMIAKNWWEFSKSKLRMLKWMEKKEMDLNQEDIGGGGLENAVDMERKLNVSALGGDAALEIYIN